MPMWYAVKHCTHSDDNKVEPTPGVREVLAQSVGADLDEHLEDEDDREHFVENVQRRFEKRSLWQLNVNILSSLHPYTHNTDSLLSRVHTSNNVEATFDFVEEQVSNIRLCYHKRQQCRTSSS